VADPEEQPRGRVFDLVVKAPPGHPRPTIRTTQIGYEDITAAEAKAHAEAVFGRPVLRVELRGGHRA
jgi:hypothetical protein